MNFALKSSKQITRYKTGMGNERIKYQQVIVHSGDTLWAISEKYSQPDRDIRALVYEIEEINQLKSSTIVPGQVLRIPTE